jgi:hypothetical protein
MTERINGGGRKPERKIGKPKKPGEFNPIKLETHRNKMADKKFRDSVDPRGISFETNSTREWWEKQIASGKIVF